MQTQKILAAVLAASLMFMAMAVLRYGVVEPTANIVSPSPVAKPSFASVIVKVQTVAIQQVSETDLDCMTDNLYFEARNQKSDAAIAAVGYVTLNRVASKQYPDTICGVVKQRVQRKSGRYSCQFSWYCDGKRDTVNENSIVEVRAYERAERIAKQVLNKSIANPIGSATMYHATYVSPYWAVAYKKVVKVEDHIFYRKA